MDMTEPLGFIAFQGQGFNSEGGYVGSFEAMVHIAEFATYLNRMMSQAPQAVTLKMDIALSTLPITKTVVRLVNQERQGIAKHYIMDRPLWFFDVDRGMNNLRILAKDVLWEDLDTHVFKVFPKAKRIDESDIPQGVLLHSFDWFDNDEAPEGFYPPGTGE